MKKMPPTPPKLATASRLLLTPALLLATGTCLLAQDDTAEEEVFTLSPFEVDASRDEGYAARETLAGTRLRTNLEDVTASVSVMTEELLADIGASDVQDALLYSVNVENEDEYHPNSSEGLDVSTTTQTRVRGLKASAQSRGYFKTNFRADTYNTGAITVSRGPNSVLYGLGSPAGIINASPKRAILSKDSLKLQHKIDTEDAHREVVDINKVLIEDKLALRLIWMNQNKRTYKQPEHDKEERLYATLTYSPTDKTTIRASYETMENDRIKGRGRLTFDFVSDWIAAGRPMYDNINNMWTYDGGATYTADAPGEGTWTENLPRRVYVVDGQIDVTSPDAPDGVQALNWANTGISYDRTQQARTFTDESIVPFDYNIHGLASGTTLEGDILNVSVEQKMTENLYLEVAYNKETYDSYFFDPLRGGQTGLQADVNMYLPLGGGAMVANPNAGRYFTDSQVIGFDQQFDFESYRATVSYELDLKERNKWLGTHTFAALYQRDNEDRFQQKLRLFNDSARQLGPNLAHGQNNIVPRYYLDVGGQSIGEGGIFFPSAFVRPEDALGANVWPTLVPGGQGDGRPSLKDLEFTAKMGVWQGSFLDGKLLTTFGYREDGLVGFKAATSLNADRSEWSVGDFPEDPSDDETGITRTTGVMYHVTDNVSVFYNRSDNFDPQGGFVDYYGNPTGPSTGEGKDIGLQFKLMEGKLTARISHYTNSADNQIETDWYYEQPKWSIVNWYEVRIENWGKDHGDAEAIADTNRPSINDDLRQTRSAESEGIEFELHAKPIQGLDLRFTLGKNEAKHSAINTSMMQYIADRLPVWSKYYDRVDPNKLNSGEITGEDETTTLPLSDDRSMGYRFFQGPSNANSFARLLAYEAQNGQVVDRLRKWRASFIANYNFTEGKAKGFGIGSGVRWREAATIGYMGTTADLSLLPFDPAYLPDPSLVTVQAADQSRPIQGEDILEFDLWLKYSKKFEVMGKNVDWRVSLNIYNLFDDQDLVPLNADVDGSILQWSPKAPRRFALTNTFSF